jgi:hypothetical protein
MTREHRFLECQYCEGTGEVCVGTATIYEHGCGFWHDDAIMSPCPACEDIGRKATELADELRERLCQHSYSIVGPVETIWSTRRQPESPK